MNDRHTQEPVLKREVIIRGSYASDEHRGVVAMLYVALGSMAMVALTPIVLVALMHSTTPMASSVSMPAPFSMSAPMIGSHWASDRAGYAYTNRVILRESDAWRGITATPAAYGLVIARSVTNAVQHDQRPAMRTSQVEIIVNDDGTPGLDLAVAQALGSVLDTVEPACYGPSLCPPRQDGDAVQVNRPANIE